MGDYEKFLSRREEECLKALGKYNENHNIAHKGIFVPKTGTHMTQSGLRSHMTRIFQRYMEAMEVMAEYSDVFERRLNNHSKEINMIKRKMAKRRKDAGER